jgi:hypothetical protein
METLERLAERSGSHGYILRPLSAALLPETNVESRGWVAREKLLGMKGRGRKAQIRMAQELGIEGYPPPGTVCRLTEACFSERVADLQRHEGLRGLKNLHLLRLGRHFRLGEGTKLVVGRNEQENIEIEGVAELYDLLMKVEHAPGPTGLLPFTASPDEVQLAAAICARYGDSNGRRPIMIRIRSSRGSRQVEVAPADDQVVEKHRI